MERESSLVRAGNFSNGATELQPQPQETTIDTLTPTLEDVFRVHEEFEIERPQSIHSSLWYQERLGHELDEWYTEDPTSPDWVDEGADVLLFWVGAMRAAGISPTVAIQAAIDKMNYNKVRFPVELFDGTNGKTYEENYAEAKRREGKPVKVDTVVYHSSFLEDTEYFGEP